MSRYQSQSSGFNPSTFFKLYTNEISSLGNKKRLTFPDEGMEGVSRIGRAKSVLSFQKDVREIVSSAPIRYDRRAEATDPKHLVTKQYADKLENAAETFIGASDIPNFSTTDGILRQAYDQNSGNTHLALAKTKTSKLTVMTPMGYTIRSRKILSDEFSFHDLVILDPTVWVAVGEDQRNGVPTNSHVILRTQDEGDTWTVQMNMGQSVSGSDSFVAYSGTKNVLVAENKQILVSHNKGVQFMAANSPPSLSGFPEIKGIAIHKDTAMAIGTDGTIIKSSDGGDTWADVTPSLDSSVKSVSGFPRGMIRSRTKSTWIAPVILETNNGGNNGWFTLLRSTDEGENWEYIRAGPKTLPSSVQDSVSPVMFGSLFIAAVPHQRGGLIVSDDGGFTFYRVATQYAVIRSITENYMLVYGTTAYTIVKLCTLNTVQYSAT
jgi:hypothetical protein